MVKGLILKQRRIFTMLTHAFLVMAAYIAAFYLRFELAIPSAYGNIILKTIPAVILIKTAVFYYFGLFSVMWRYVNMDDLWQIIKANIAATCVFILFTVFFIDSAGIPRSIFVLDWGLSIAFIAGARFMSRALRERVSGVRDADEKSVLIVGAGDAGILVLRELRVAGNYNVIGFVDDDPAKKGMRLHGKKILGDRFNIKDIAEKHMVEEIIIAIPSARGEVIRKIIPLCQLPGLKVKIVPAMKKILSGEIEVKFRDVEPEDLLGRESVEIDEKDITGYIRNKVVLITGAGGSIGSEIARQVTKFLPREVILLDYNENDLYFLELELKTLRLDFAIRAIAADSKDTGVLKSVFAGFRPHIVFHAAAFKHVPLMEENPASAIINNVVGTRNIINAAENYNAESFVLISSDKAVNPTSVMGATKRLAEMILQAKSKKSGTKFMAVRFGNVLGSKGSVVPLFKKQIGNERRVTVTHPEAKRYFMSVNEAVQLVLQAGAIGKGGEIFVLDMGEQITIVELAKALISLSGLKPGEDIPIEFIGLRPGEKLFEETFLDTEKATSTKNEKIFITQAGDFDMARINKDIDVLEKLSILMDKNAIIKKLCEIVPSYIGQTTGDKADSASR